MKKLKLFTFLFTINLVFIGCYEDNLIFNPDEAEIEVEIKGEIEDFYSQAAITFDSLTFDADDRLLFVTENETVIEIQAGSFLDQDASNATGDVQLKYIEVLNPAEYAFYNLPTISDGHRLRTEGVFRFEVTKDGEKLALKPGKGIFVRLPDEAPENGMQLFTGQGEGENFNWQLNEQTTNVDNNVRISEWFVELVDSTNQEFITGFGYLFTCDLFQWINVDIFADIPEGDKTTVCVELPEIYTPKNTVVFMFFNGEKSILGLYPNEEKMKWCEPYGATPKGFTVTLFAISSQGDETFHFAIQESVVTEEHVVFLEPEEKSLLEIIEVIKKLE